MTDGRLVRKFVKGDIVRLKLTPVRRGKPKYVPLSLLDVPKEQISHPRTIIAVRYDQKKQRSFYRLGSNSRGHMAHDGNPQAGWAYEFRSCQLELYTPRPYHRRKDK